LDIVGTLGVSDKVNYGATGQTRNTYHAKQWKAAAGFLLGFLRINGLIGRSVWHRQAGPIDDFNAVTAPQSLCGHALLGQAVSMSENLFDPVDRQALASLAVGRSVVGKGTPLTLRLGASLDLPKRLPTGSPGVEHLPEKTQESARKGKGALPAVGAIVGRAEQISRQERLQQGLELG